MNPLWGLKPVIGYHPLHFWGVPKSMNPLWGLKQLKRRRLNHGDSDRVPKSMNPLWGLKRCIIAVVG